MTGLCTSDDIDIPGCTDAMVQLQPKCDHGRRLLRLLELLGMHQPRCMQLQPCGGHGRRFLRIHQLRGLHEVLSCNFDPNATIDDGSCILPYDIVYEDLDGDGIGGSVGIADVCELGPGLSLETGDCDDDNNTVYPGASGRQKASTTIATASSMPMRRFQTCVGRFESGRVDFRGGHPLAVGELWLHGRVRSRLEQRRRNQRERHSTNSRRIWWRLRMTID